MNKKSLVFCMLFALFLMPLVAADFTVRTEMATNSVCPSSTILIQDIVTSLGNAPYSITISGPAASFTTAVPPGFYLNQGQSQTIFLYITPPSTTMPNTYNLIVNIESQGTTKQVSHTIIVENCHSTSLTAKQETIELCSCDEKDLILVLQNNGKYNEQYELSINGFASGWLTLSPSSLTMLPGSKSDIIAHLKVPCGESGDFETTFNVKGKNSIAQASDKVLIKVYPCYDYSISSEKNYYEICENKELSIPITIKNLGTQDNFYQINFNGPSWSNLDKKDLSIKKGEIGVFNLIASPPLRTTGEFSANVEVMSANGKVIKKQEIKLDSVKCYDHSLAIAEEKEIICNGLTASYALKVKNLGRFDQTYDLILESPVWVSLSENKVILKAGEEKSLSLTIAPPKDSIAQSYAVKIKAQDVETKITAEDSLIVMTATQEQCYKPAISSEKDSIDIARDRTGTLAFIIENQGTQTAVYDIAVSGTATTFSQINPGAITIEPAKAQNLYLYIAPSPEVPLGNYTATVTARLKDTTILASKTVTISVTEAKGAEEEQETQPAALSLGKIWNSIVNFFKSIFTFEQKEKPAEIIIIGGNETKNETTPTQPETPIQPPVNETNQTQPIEPVQPPANETQTQPPAQTPVEPANTAPNLKKNIPEIKMQPGTAYTLDLNEYFADADGDTLFYTAVKPLNMTLQVNQNVVTIKSTEEGFVGERTITFYASDGKETTPSNQVKITVSATATASGTGGINFSEILDKYKYYFIGTAILIIIIIILLSGLGEKIVDFFEEEVEDETPKENNKKK